MSKCPIAQTDKKSLKYLTTRRFQAIILPFFLVDTDSQPTPFWEHVLGKLPPIAYSKKKIENRSAITDVAASRTNMSWGVKFWKNLDTPDASIFNKFLNISACVNLVH